MKYRTFGKTGLSVSQLALGTGNFGTGWGHGADPLVSKAIFNAYAEAGGNFIDTADIYQFGQSEALLGTLLEGRRDDFVLATKFTKGASANPGRLTTGNSRKAMVSSLEASLKRLKTDRIDLYWVHHPDAVTPIEEILRGFEDLARAGKILYAGLSNFPAWRLARAVTLAEVSRTLPIAAAQFEHSLVHREPETDLFQASYALGLGVVTWSPLGGGMLTGKYRKGEKGRAEGFGGKVFQPENTVQRTLILDTVLEIADELGVSAGQVAIAWAGSHGAVPIIGPRSHEQIADNLGALSLTLADEQTQRLDSVSNLNPSLPARSAADRSNETRAQVIA
ncbi:aldo/keto reductase [Pseudomonas syringae pv. tagetis]|uniref:Aldo/keto reductase n=2 Tax=Pseudomonas syringae group genomosp. 7 TaxID=251699 RepID=A0A0Q0BHE6_9PSED|nr:aldo/keto reductase [Pseudomonas syringae group genomosp. 7]KPX42446.1 Aldo/keto reductase family oxidoreductase [Pseudomonas syringae pv. helianthi]KPY89130.1 Aldo/keto reductase family oxidoreductase [Pseudomonas syringae pv. tagetis]RMR01966.1 Aldo/keto reductase family oxidoreductase [Pseudomonas syringae pv. helianthi]RMW19033.1 Aldo/keto reductase family oxidoreductase [Pseudomonas syringae pv. tagetis]UNB65604.1 aldo/keto reductase [Pseudomonas syringae pv. helianthi]